MNRKRLGTISAVLALFVASLATIGAQAAPQDKSVYIVKFQDNVSLGDEISATRRSGVSVTQVLEHAFKGFIGEMTAGQATALARNPRVEFVEEDSTVSKDATQSRATWGLDRIDQNFRPLNSTYSYVSEGAGVRAYVIDTGILSQHEDLVGRVLPGYTAFIDGKGTEDCDGHGTHVAGTIGGTIYGVAKAVNLVPVRVLNCTGSGTTSGVVAGVDWVTSEKKKSLTLKAVANMSLGGGPSSAIDTAVSNLVSAGVVVVVAAGNSNKNACNYSPARVASAITVGATTSSDSRASYSNFGSCLDIFAPGSSITSAWHTSVSATNTISGTSMAAPHVAGVVARYLASASGTASGATQAILNASTKNVVTSAGSRSPNRLLYWNPEN